MYIRKRQIYSQLAVYFLIYLWTGSMSYHIKYERKRWNCIIIRYQQNQTHMRQQEKINFFFLPSTAEIEGPLNLFEYYYEEWLCCVFEILQKQYCIGGGDLSHYRYYYRAKDLLAREMEETFASCCKNTKIQESRVEGIIQKTLNNLKSQMNPAQLHPSQKAEVPFINYQLYPSGSDCFDNPFDILSQYKKCLEPKIKLALCQLLVLALTKAQFKHVQPQYLVQGSLRSISEVKGLNLNLAQQDGPEGVKINDAKALFTKLLQNIETYVQQA